MHPSSKQAEPTYCSQPASLPHLCEPADTTQTPAPLRPSCPEWVGGGGEGRV